MLFIEAANRNDVFLEDTNDQKLNFAENINDL